MERVLRVLITLVTLVGMLLSFPKAFADKFNTELSSSAEALGMGGTGINLSRGSYSVFYNPANISSKETKTQFQLVNFQFDGNNPLLSLGGSLPKVMNLSSLYTVLAQNPNTYYGARYSVYPNVTFRFFSFGLLYEYNQGALLRAADNSLNIKARDRFGPNAAFSFRLFSGIFRFGANFAAMSVGSSNVMARRGANTEPPNSYSTANLDYKSFIASGTGISKNAGMTITAPFRYFPSVSVVARDIGGTTYSLPSFLKFGNMGKPDTQPMTIDLAGSLTVYLARRLEFRGEFDYRDITQSVSGNQLRRMFTGVELIFYDFLHFRGGFMHGYPTAGLGITTKQASLDLAVYSEELEDSLRGSSDTRAVLQYSWGLFK